MNSEDNCLFGSYTAQMIEVKSETMLSHCRASPFR